MAQPPESDDQNFRSAMDIDIDVIKKGGSPQSQFVQEANDPDVQIDEIESRLEKILESDPETGHEKVSLFAGRCALRSFPFGIAVVAEGRREEIGIPPVLYISTIWRAIMSAWNYVPEIAVESALAVSGPAFDGSDVASAAFDAAMSASSSLSTMDVVNAFTMTSSFFNHAAALDDLIFLESQSSSPAELRRKPLWLSKIPDQFFSETDWPLAINNLITKTDIDTEKNLLQKIKRDYQAILKGTWDEDEIDAKPETLTRDTAVEKPEDDKPSADDFLGRDKLVKALEPRLSIPDDDNHLTIGLLGDWGIGKSSVIEQLQKRLDKNNWHTVYLYGNFNAWKYEKTESLQAGMAHEVIAALSSGREDWPWYKRGLYRRLVIGEYASRTQPVWVLIIFSTLVVSVVLAFNDFLPDLNIGGVKIPTIGWIGSGILLAYQFLRTINTISAQPLAKNIKSYFSLPSFQKYLGSIPLMEKQINTLCEICLNKKWFGKQQKLVFFIDDLDRCGVDGIVQTFEAVRLVLGIRWVTVVIAMDQRIALPALACHYKQLSEFHQSDPMSIARDYLAKVIHLPVSLPPPDDLGVAQYLAYIWNDQAFFEQRKPQPEIIPENKDEQAELPEEKTSNSDREEPNETLQDIITDINSMDVRAALMPDPIEPTGEKNVETIQQLSDQQKVAFYDWLLKLNLRNPRQVKRLYNSYNLLWSHYSEDWPSDEHGHPYMVALFVIEMINEFVIHVEKKDTKTLLREAFFSLKDAIHMPEISGVSFVDMSEARQVIYQYQIKYPETQLLSRIEPFVLPASRPQGSDSN